MHRFVPKTRWNVALIVQDRDLRGWNNSDLARQAGLSVKTVIRFLEGHPQTAKTAKKIARALRYSVERYALPPTREEVAV